MLKSCHTRGVVEAGCDEAGRGCLAGPVFAAAVIFPEKYRNGALNDSKVLSVSNRSRLRAEIERDALAWAVAQCSPEEIDRINILNASILAMHRALDQLSLQAGLILVDGNRFKVYRNTPHHCIVKGDGKYLSIAAASILAKTWRDDYMEALHHDFPQYGWLENKGYPTPRHREAVRQYGITPHHRKTFQMAGQLKLSF